MKFFHFLGQPKFLRAFHGVSIVFWLLLWGVATITGWIKSVEFVSHLSAIALVLASWASWQAARVEVEVENGNGN